MAFRSLYLMVGRFVMPDDWLGASVAGLYIDDLYFLTGVGVLWYLVGRSLDRRRARPAFKAPTATGLIARLLMLAVAGYLLVLGLGWAWNPHFDNPSLVVVPMLTWSLILMFLAARWLVTAFRSVYRAPGSP
jgi:hypothetical protein